MPTDEFVFDLISGDWLYDSDRDGFTCVYEGIVTSSWSGGVEWIVSRAVVEKIVEDQERFNEEQRARPDVPGEESVERLVWDGDVLLHLSVDGETYRREPVDPQGNYSVGFGWIWAPVDDDDRFFEIVRNDGTAEKNELELAR